MKLRPEFCKHYLVLIECYRDHFPHHSDEDAIIFYSSYDDEPYLRVDNRVYTVGLDGRPMEVFGRDV